MSRTTFKVDKSMLWDHGTFTMKVVRSVFVLAMRGHDILYSDWGRYSIDRYIALTLTYIARVIVP